MDKDSRNSVMVAVIQRNHCCRQTEMFYMIFRFWAVMRIQMTYRFEA